MDRGRQRVLLVLAVVGSIGWLVVTRSVAAYLATTAVVGLVAVRTSRWLGDREDSHGNSREGGYAPPPATQWPDGL